jgi:hypothetical protein
MYSLFMKHPINAVVTVKYSSDLISDLQTLSRTPVSAKIIIMYPQHKLNKFNYTPRRSLERRYSSYSFSTSALDGGEWSVSRPGRALAPKKGPPVPIVQETGWAPQPVWTQKLEEKSFRLCRGSNLDQPEVQPVARHYTD